MCTSQACGRRVGAAHSIHGTARAGVQSLSLVSPLGPAMRPGRCPPHSTFLTSPAETDLSISASTSASILRQEPSAPQPPTCPVGFECVPHVAIEVVIPGEEEAATLGEGDGGDPADDIVMGVRHELLIRTQVEQPAGGVVRASGKCIAVGEELGRESTPTVCKGTKPGPETRLLSSSRAAAVMERATAGWPRRTETPHLPGSRGPGNRVCGPVRQEHAALGHWLSSPE